MYIYTLHIYDMNIEHTRIPAGSVHPNDRRWHRQIAFAESHAHRCAGHGFGLGSHIIFKSRFSFGVRRHAALTLSFVPPFSLSYIRSLSRGVSVGCSSHFYQSFTSININSDRRLGFLSFHVRRG